MSIAGDLVAEVPATVASTGEAYSGQLWASVTGPDKQPVRVPFRTADGDVDQLPIAATAGETLAPNYSLVLPEGMAAGQHEVTLHVGPQVGEDQELAVYGLRVDEAGIPIPDPLGSLPLGSSTLDLGSLQSGSGQLGS